jgi:hypothetical protein
MQGFNQGIQRNQRHSIVSGPYTPSQLHQKTQRAEFSRKKSLKSESFLTHLQSQINELFLILLRIINSRRLMMQFKHILLSAGMIFVSTGCLVDQDRPSSSSSSSSSAQLIGSDASDHAREDQGKLKMMMRSTDKKAVVSSSVARINFEVAEMRIRNTDGEFFRFDVDPFMIDLIEFDDSLSTVLARAKLLPGEYDHIRLVIPKNGELEWSNGNVEPVFIPSGAQSGLKIFFDEALVIEEELLSVAVLEVDLIKSLVFRGKSRAPILFKPVIHTRVVNQIDLADLRESNDSSNGENDATPGSGSGDGSSDGEKGDSGYDGGRDNGSDNGSDDHHDYPVEEDDYDDTIFIPIIGV